MPTITLNIHLLGASGQTLHSMKFRTKLDTMPPVGMLIDFGSYKDGDGNELPLQLVVIQSQLEWQKSEWGILLDEPAMIKPVGSAAGYIYVQEDRKEGLIEHLKSLGFEETVREIGV